MRTAAALRDTALARPVPTPIPRSDPSPALSTAHPTVDGYFDMAPSHHGSRHGSPVASVRCSSMSIQMPPSQSAMDMAFTALQYLPMPLLVLSSNKTVVLANEALGRLFGVDPTLVMQADDALDAQDLARASSGPRSVTDILYGLSIRSLGIDLLQNGSPVWVTWEDFLDSLLDDSVNDRRPSADGGDQTDDGEATPKLSAAEPSGAQQSRTTSLAGDGNRTMIHEVVVDVAFSAKRDPLTGLPQAPVDNKRRSSPATQTTHIEATLIISTWFIDGEQHYTLTFTAAHSVQVSQQKSSSRTVTKMHRNYMSGMGSGSSSGSGGRRTQMSSHSSSPGSSSMMWLPNGPASQAPSSTVSTLLSKSNKMKDAMLNALSIPVYAMWKDESFGIPNKAALRLLGKGASENPDTPDERGFLGQFKVYSEDFSRELPLDEYPIFHLMRTKKRFTNMRVGMYNSVTDQRIIFDVDGEEILDEKTGEFLGGIVMFRDVTSYANTINAQKIQNERQFEDIANTIPVMVWTAHPDGEVDYFSKRWYEYTGMTAEECLGDKWAAAFVTEDAVIAGNRWRHSLATGKEYLTEYRCRAHTGEYRWMLGRALPMRDQSGAIIRWFGTCTDIHELVEAREEAKQTREQLLKVIDHAKITLWAIDKEKRLVLHEGRRFTKPNAEPGLKLSLGRNVFDVFADMTDNGFGSEFKKPINDILAGRASDELVETAVPAAGRWYRTRFVPLQRQRRDGGITGDVVIDGVVGLSMDVTELKKREEELRERERENGRLLAQSEAAKEASKMKSQFLANMSHEIRTPIAGVIGMAELLLDDTEATLTRDQRECAENLQRSANGLLTVINDILDFSKVESGRLDIEEVQFDLNVVVRDVNKMLSFAAERKGLTFIDETQELQRLKVIGDPGRLRQILTNLLTNSIKFTSDGHVRMAVQIMKENSEKVVVKFLVEDTGIGIEEEVRKRLFQPFSQADSSTARRFGGTGLGLTISKNLVELMHGDISLDSILGQGTRATFWIPFAKTPFYSEDSPALDMGPLPDRLQSELSVSDYATNSMPTSPGNSVRRQSSNSGAAGQGKLADLSEEERRRIHVLVVEDNPINQQIALKTIKKLGFSVNAVWNGQEALDYLLKPSTTDHPKPDIILMDVQMPVMDGYKATFTIRHAEPYIADARIQNTPIVAMTASAIQGDREKCESAGMNDYLSKPVKGKVLEKMLVKWALEIKKKRKRSLSSSDARPSVKRQGTIQRFGAPLAPSPSRPAPAIGSEDSSRQSSSDSVPRVLPSRPASLQHHHSSGRTLPPEALAQRLEGISSLNASAVRRASDTPAARVQNHYDNEEKAMRLRDEQLIASAGDPKLPIRGASDETLPGDALVGAPGAGEKLTAQNVGRLGLAARVGRLRADGGDEDDGSSARATAGEG